MMKKEEKKKPEIKMHDKYIKWFSDVDKDDIKLVGGKAANLGEMISLDLPVPPGFVVNASGYKYFLDETELADKIYAFLGKIDVEKTEELEETAKEIRNMIIKAEMPSDLREEILEAYNILGEDNLPATTSENVLKIMKISEPRFVAVRSSATAEDTKEASFAGQQETFLNVKGKENLIENVKKCFASLFTARSIYYRVKKGFKHENVLNAVIVQVMIAADKSGVIFSRDPVTKEENVVIEAVFGFGEGIVSGKIKPDYYLVNRDLKILKKEMADKKIAITRTSAGEEMEVKLTEEKSKQQVLNNSEIKKLAGYALELEEHYNTPQDIEFAIDSGKIFIVQTRPVTTLEKEIEKEEVEGRELLFGLAASPGIGSGKVKIIRKLEDLSKIEKGEVLVTKMTNPDMVVTMQKCSGIITDEGGITAHASIVSREMGIPCVVGTGNATQKLKDGQIVTVDGFKGKVYEGSVEELRKQGVKIDEEEKVEILPVAETETKTKIKVMVDLPSFAERASKTNIREVGLLRLEGIIAESGKHPLNFLKEGKINEYENLIFEGISKIAEFFDSLWIRTSDIRSDEFRNLKGASKEVEANPMLGMHGIRESLEHRKILRAELRAMSRLAEKEKKIGVLLPQVISVSEVKEVKEILRELNIENLKLGVMIETPASVQIIEELCKEGINFISFGTNDLTQYTLAVDRGNEQVQDLYNEMHPAVLSQLEKVIEVCKENNVETSICGQAGSKKEMVEFLVKKGIDSISVNADKAKEISEFVKELEDAEEEGLRGKDLKEETEVEEEGKMEEDRQTEQEKEQEEPEEDKEENQEIEETVEEEPAEEEKEEEKPFEEEAEDEEETEEEKKEEETEQWKEDVEYGFDVFASQQAPKQEEEQEVREEEKSEEEREQVEIIKEEEPEEAEEEKEAEDEEPEEEGEEEPEEEKPENREEEPEEKVEIIEEELEEKKEASEQEKSEDQVLDIF